MNSSVRQVTSLCVTTNEHNGHMHNSVKKMADKHRKEMEKMVEPVEMINGLSMLHPKVVAAGEKIASQASEVDQQIGFYYEELTALTTATTKRRAKEQVNRAVNKEEGNSWSSWISQKPIFERV